MAPVFFSSSNPLSPDPPRSGANYLPPASIPGAKRRKPLIEMQHVPGKDRGRVVLYALSTCGWCARTKELLTDLGVGFSYVYVDLLAGEERDRVVREVERWNPRLSFPTVVIDDARVVVGFREDEIREAVGA